MAYERFKQAQSKNQADQELTSYLNTALQFYNEALELLPPDAVNDLAVVHHGLGVIYQSAHDLDRALPYYREAIHYEELQNNFYGAGQTRFNVAITLANAARFEDALLYAQAALRNFEPYGAGAAADIEDTQRLITAIQEAMQDET